MPGIGVISNKNARLNRLHPGIRDRMAFVVGRDGEVASTGTLDDTQKAVQEFRRVDVDMLAISGGDGTAHRTLEVVIAEYGATPPPPILLLPTGTQNMVPNSFGIRTSGVATLLLAQARYRHNVPIKSVRRNLLRVNNHLSFMCGLGVAPRFLKEYYGRGKTTPWGAIQLLGEYALDALRGGKVARELAKPCAARIQVDGGPARRIECHTFFASFVEELALRFRCFPRAGWDEGVFEVLIGSGQPSSVARAIPSLWAGSVGRREGLERLLSRSLVLELDAPEPYTLDGEVYEPTRSFEISAGPELSFVVPGLRLRRLDPRIRTGQIGPWSFRFLV